MLRKKVDERQVGPTGNSYKKYEPPKHVYMKSDTYIGADEKVRRQEWLFDVQNRRMVEAMIDFVPGSERIFIEVLTNASDNVGRSRRAGVDPGIIEIIMNNSTVCVTNYGLPIPVEIHPTEGVYVPQLIFGELLTSSNYEVDRHEAGTNGIGAKATNIYSKEFMVIIHDKIRGLKYTQVWNNNMQQRGEPIIEQYQGEISSVQVIYKMDFERFGYTVPVGDEGGYPVEAYSLFARHGVDISFTAKTTVKFNGHEFNYQNIRDYARLYFGEAADNAIVHYQWPDGTEIIKKKKGYQVSKTGTVNPEIELIALDTPDEGHHVSFVNCMMTREGGVHVNAAVKAVADSTVQLVNDTVMKGLIKQNKGKELDAKEKRSHSITINDVKPHISILLNAKLKNPKFVGQTKTQLHTPVPKISIAEEQLKSISKWKLVDRLYAAIDAKQYSSLSKKDGKLRKYVKLMKGVDANNAGKAKRHECVLYITEGKSGAGYANKLVALVPGGRDNVGVLPMKGKSLNVMNAGRFQLEKSNEIGELVKMLGLKYCLDEKMKDTYYLENSNFNTLRYGGVMIMADSDVDGKHIIGLILNFFYCFFPSLLARGFVMYYRTPTIRVTYNRNVIKFYTQREYDEWQIDTPNYMNWKHKYYKGLGTSNDAEIKDDYKAPRIVQCFYDEHAPEAMRLAFDKKMTNQRKDWLGKWRPVLGLGIDDIKLQPISWFINHELILFSIEDTQRSIPKLTDGLKVSLRKILYASHLRWKISPKNKDYSEYKVAQLAAFVADKAYYHHGEVVLGDVIVGMAQDFTGSNNIPWFTKDGQFGCFDPETPVLIWDGSTKLAKDITTSDILIGDDGKQRHISQIVSGTDDMYEVVQRYGHTYRVNKQHILTLYFPCHKIITWDQIFNGFSMIYFDTTNKTVSTFRSQVSDTLSKADAERLISQFAETIPDDDKIFDINLQTYLSFSDEIKALFKSVHNFKPVDWPKTNVSIYPYMYGNYLANEKMLDQIGNCYIYNNIENRLELLAGIIDAQGSLIYIGGVNRFLIRTFGRNPEKVIYLANSLGFYSNVLDVYHESLIIGGDIHRIPTRFTATRCPKQEPFIGMDIEVKHIGRGRYVGWYIDANERFLLADWTCVHNTRYEGGKDAAQTRYSFVRPERLVGYIIRKEDKPILKHVIDEGNTGQPETFYPIIPMVLVNGAQGIGTGYSTFIPCHNPLDLINWLRIKLKGGPDDDLPNLLPWYRGFEGIIKVIDRRDRKRKNKVGVTLITNVNDNGVIVPKVQNFETEDQNFEAEDQNFEAENENERPLLSMISMGNYHVNSDNTIIITELPIGYWPIKFRKHLENLLEEKKITNYRDLSVDNSVYFEITGFTSPISHRSLGLIRCMSMSNMVLLDAKSHPVRYDTSFDIIESFYSSRIPIYELRKQHIIKTLSDEIDILNHKIRFIQAVINKEILVIDQKKVFVYQAMDVLGIPHEIYDRSMLGHLSKDDIESFTAKILEKETQRDNIIQTPVQQIWLNELDELESVYRSIYVDAPVPKPKIIPQANPKKPSRRTSKSTPKTPLVLNKTPAPPQPSRAFVAKSPPVKLQIPVINRKQII